MRAAISQAEEVAETEPTLQMVEALREAVPAVGKAITMREVVRASFDPSARAPLQERIVCPREARRGDWGSDSNGAENLGRASFQCISFGDVTSGGGDGGAQGPERSCRRWVDLAEVPVAVDGPEHS